MDRHNNNTVVHMAEMIPRIHTGQPQEATDLSVEMTRMIHMVLQSDRRMLEDMGAKVGITHRHTVVDVTKH